MLSLDLDYPARAAAHARRLDEIASSLTARAHHLAASGSAGSWAGPASRAFHREAHSALAQVRHAAASMHAAADAVRHHGALTRQAWDAYLAHEAARP